MESPSSSTDSIPRGPAFIAGLLIVLVALALRWPQFHGDSLWLDELHSAWCASGSWNDVAPRAGIGNQSPVDFLLLRGVVAVSGMSEFSLRLPSLIAGLGLVGVSGFATARWTGSVTAGLFAASLVAIDRNCIFYSQEARPYAILQLTAWCHAVVVWKLAHQAKIAQRALFVLGATVQFYLHYTSVLFLLAEAVFLIDVVLDQRNRAGYRWGPLVLDFGMIGVAILPALQHLIEIHSRRKQWELFVKPLPTLYDFWHTLRLDSYLLPSLALYLVWYLLRRGSQSELPPASIPSRRTLSLVGSALLVPAVIAWVATRRHLAALFMTRYLVCSLVAAPIVAAAVNRVFPLRWLARVAMVVTVGVAVWQMGMWQQWQRDGRLIGDRRQDWRGAVEFVNGQAAGSNAICYVRSGFIEEETLQKDEPDPLLVEYCLSPVNSLYKLRVQAIPIASPHDIKIDSEWLRGEEERWFLINGRLETRQRFVARVQQQCQQSGLPDAFETQREFGDILVCKLAGKTNR